MVSDLHNLAQKPDETLRKYIQRFYQVQHTIPDVSLDAIIAVFHVNVRDPEMREKMSTHAVRSTAELFQLAREVVLDHLTRDPEHIEQSPGEHIGICLEKAIQCAFLLVGEVTANLDGLSGIIAKLYHLGCVVLGSGYLGIPGWWGWTFEVTSIATMSGGHQVEFPYAGCSI